MSIEHGYEPRCVCVMCVCLSLFECWPSGCACSVLQQWGYECDQCNSSPECADVPTIAFLLYFPPSSFQRYWFHKRLTRKTWDICPQSLSLSHTHTHTHTHTHAHTRTHTHTHCACSWWWCQRQATLSMTPESRMSWFVLWNTFSATWVFRVLETRMSWFVLWSTFSATWVFRVLETRMSWSDLWNTFSVTCAALLNSCSHGFTWAYMVLRGFTWMPYVHLELKGLKSKEVENGWAKV
jgi:hypothetical protein